MSDIIAGFLMGGFLVLLASAWSIFNLIGRIDYLRISLENARASIDYWHDRYEEESEKRFDESSV